jgi:hypothetical protein
MKPEYRLHTPEVDDIYIPDRLWNLNIVYTLQKMMTYALLIFYET